MQDAHVQQSMSADRRIDLDWIRITAFGLLILYHVGMVFVPWYYHVKSTQLVVGLEPLMLALNPWRLSLLFLVAGAATRFMAAKTAPRALLKSRSARLLVPLAFGILVIVPPQSYWEVVSHHVYDGSFYEFYASRYFSFSAQFCTERCIILPTWNHLWFVAYLSFYTAVVMLLVALMPRGAERMGAIFERCLTGIGLFVLPAFVLAIYRVFLFPKFPPTNALIGDWYNHALYFSAFATGFLIARSEPVWAAIFQWRWVALVIAAIAFGVFITAHTNPPIELSSSSTALVGIRTVYGIYQWCVMLAVLGFGRRWLTRDSSARRYLTDAIFPYYIIHQTVILGVAFVLREARLSVLTEATIIIAVTAASCVLTYEIVRRVSWLRPLFGLKKQPALA